MTLEEIASYLDITLATRPLKYMDEVKAIKVKGYKIFRNSEGKHKVQIAGSVEDIFNIFGGCFNGKS